MSYRSATIPDNVRRVTLTQRYPPSIRLEVVVVTDSDDNDEYIEGCPGITTATINIIVTTSQPKARRSGRIMSSVM